jgi:hypothetical protein
MSYHPGNREQWSADMWLFPILILIYYIQPYSLWAYGPMRSPTFTSNCRMILVPVVTGLTLCSTFVWNVV